MDAVMGEVIRPSEQPHRRTHHRTHDNEGLGETSPPG
jgi:hypothetical protein